MIVTSGNAIKATESAKQDISTESNGLKPVRLMHVPRILVNENRKTAEIAPRCLRQKTSIAVIVAITAKCKIVSEINRYLHHLPTVFDKLRMKIILRIS